MKFPTLALLLVSIAPSIAYQTSSSSTSSRRAWFQQVATAASSSLLLSSSLPANAVTACPKGSQNCIVTSWTPPASASKDDIVRDVTAVLTSYPQEGQNGIDNRGYDILSDASTGVAKVEYKNFGNFAKFLNGGKPFVDDLVIEITGGSAVAVKSSSRIGDSDLGVNKKRLDYLGEALKAKGWTVPEAKY